MDDRSLRDAERGSERLIAETAPRSRRRPDRLLRISRMKSADADQRVAGKARIRVGPSIPRLFGVPSWSAWQKPDDAQVIAISDCARSHHPGFHGQADDHLRPHRSPGGFVRHILLADVDAVRLDGEGHSRS